MGTPQILAPVSALPKMTAPPTTPYLRIPLFLLSLPRPRHEFLLLPPQARAPSLSWRAGVGWIGQPSAGPLPLVLLSIPATSSYHCQGWIRCSWRLPPAVTVLISGPPPRDQQQLSDPPKPWSPCPALAWLLLRWGRRDEPQTLLLRQPSTPLGRQGMARKEGASSWAFLAFSVTQERAAHIYPTGSPRAIPHCFLPFSVPNDFQNDFSQIEFRPHTHPHPLRPHIHILATNPRPVVELGSEAHLGEGRAHQGDGVPSTAVALFCAFLDTPHKQSGCCLHEGCLWKTHKEVHICPMHTVSTNTEQRAWALS